MPHLFLSISGTLADMEITLVRPEDLAAGFFFFAGPDSSIVESHPRETDPDLRQQLVAAVVAAELDERAGWTMFKPPHQCYQEVSDMLASRGFNAFPLPVTGNKYRSLLLARAVKSTNPDLRVVLDEKVRC